MRALGGERSLHKILLQQEQALDLIKISHNMVRAVNHFLADQTLNRWIDEDVLSGSWREDKRLFGRYWKLFTKADEDAYSGVAQNAYKDVRKIVLRRRRGEFKG